MKLPDKYKLLKEGKTYDVYSGDEFGKVFIVGTDRVLASGKKPGIEVLDKGKLDTGVSAFWHMMLKKYGMRTAFLSSNTPVCCDDRQTLIKPEFNTPELYGRVTKQLELYMIPVRCIVRGYIVGSAWELYKNGQREFCGVKLPDGLNNGDKLPNPIFTPKDEKDIDIDEMADILWEKEIAGYDTVLNIRTMCIWAYNMAHKYALSCGLILADTEFKLGVYGDGNIYFGGEMFTSDTSRYWGVGNFAPGREQGSYQIENYARAKKSKKIPEEVTDLARQRYIDLFEKVTRMTWGT